MAGVLAFSSLVCRVSFAYLLAGLHHCRKSGRCDRGRVDLQGYVSPSWQDRQEKGLRGKHNQNFAMTHDNRQLFGDSAQGPSGAALHSVQFVIADYNHG